MVKIRSIREVQEEIGEYDRVLNSESKEIRLRILNTYIEVIKNKWEYRKLREEYIEKCTELNKITEGGIPLGLDLEENIKILADYIQNSNLISMLDQNLVKQLNFNELKNVSYPLRKKFQKDYDTLSLTVDIYYLINEILNNIMKRMSLIRKNIGKDIDHKLLEKCNRDEVQNNGKNVINIKAKTELEYMACRDLVYIRFDELLEQGVINQLTYDCAMTLVNEVFNYYIDGFDEIVISNSKRSEKKLKK